jgi:hypothetical protein
MTLMELTMVTFPGADGLFSNGDHSAGNPLTREHHYMHIRMATRKVSSWNLHAQIIGLMLMKYEGMRK